MMYIIDTANLDSIRHCVEYYPVDGVTTNPTIISRENADFPKLIKDIRSIIGADRQFHIQVTGSTSRDIIREALAIRDFIGGNLYIKVPISAEGLRATVELKKLGLKVTETAIFTQQQALIAAKAGADFVAPYVNRLDNIVSDGVNVVGEIVQLFKEYNLPSKVLAASFKTVEQIHKIAMAGSHAITISPELFDTLTYHPMTLYAIDDFVADWESVYGKKTILEMFEEHK
ncbi:MAG: fructose-6-phosphate aldolase [Clostridia bacterium]|nr:fructose-6-phosphate aldolase [Clostridia bacterium]MBQ4574945.1 fructose-6-phosphate aldolase [Clostridia bacterium]